MPIFEYQCKACCHEFEQLVLGSDTAAVVCPVCACGDVQKQISAGTVRPHGIPSGAGGFNPPACKPAGGG